MTQISTSSTSHTPAAPSDPGLVPAAEGVTPGDAGAPGAPGVLDPDPLVRDEPSDAGMATAEYAIVTVAAAGFAGLLLVILRSDEVRGLLLGIVRSALAI